MAEANSINTQTSSFQLGVQEHPLATVDWYTINTGVTISDILTKIPDNGGSTPSLLVNGEVKSGDYFIQSEDTVNVVFIPAGLDPFTLFLIVLASTISLTLLINSFLPDAPETEAEKAFNRISGLSNKTPLYEPFPMVLGKRKIAPIYISRPYTNFDGQDEYLYALFSAGYGPLKLENFRFGSVGIDEFEDGDIELIILDHYENTDETLLRNFWTNDIFQESIDIQLEEENGFTLKSSAVGASSVKSTFVLPQGGFKSDSKGNKKAVSYKVRQDFQDEDGDWWTRTDLYNIGRTSTIEGTVSVNNGVYYLWTVDDQLIQWNNGTWLSANSVVIPSSDIVGDTGLIYILTHVYVKNVDVNIKVPSLPINSNTSDFNSKVLTIERTVDFWPTDSSSEINTRTRLEYPSAQEIEDDSISGVVMFDNMQTIRPLSDSAFTKAIGGDRTPRYINGTAVDVFKPTVIGLKIKATGQLNGSIDNFYCDATMVVPDNKSVDWSNWSALTLEPSTNPADAYKWVMQGPANYRPVPHYKINETALSDWRDRCDELYEGNPQWTISATVDKQSSMLKILSDIAYVGRASFHFDEGKFSVIEKIENTLPVQVFTPRNSANFQSKRIYPEVTDGIKVTFDSAERDYEQDEIVFNDPTKTDADKKGRYNSTSMWGVDNYDQAYRLSRLAYYEQLLRREIYSFTTDIEARVCKRGDLIYIQNDMINVGTSAGRIIDITGNIITIDETIDAEDIVTGGLQIRNSTGGVVTTAADYLGDGRWDCTTIGGNTNVGDLIVYGELGHESLPCIVASISYDEDMVASITAYNAANEVFSYDEDAIPVYNSNISLPISVEQPNAPVIDVRAYQGITYMYISSKYRVNDQNYKVYVQARIIPEGLTSSDLPDNEGWGYVLQGEVISPSYQLNTLVRGENYQIRAQYRTDNNKVSLWSDVVDLFVPLGNDLIPVGDVDYIHGLDSTLITYDPVNFTDFDRYEIRTDVNFDTIDSNYIGSTKDTTFYLGLLAEDPLLVTTNYTYYIATRNTYGAYSEPTTIVIEATPPSNPISFSAELEGFSVRLSWGQVISAYSIAYYEVRYTESDIGNDFSQSINLGKFGAQSITHGTADIGIYNYYVRSVDIAGQVSEWVNVAVDVTNSIESLFDKFDEVEATLDEYTVDIDALYDERGRQIAEIQKELSQDNIETITTKAKLGTAAINNEVLAVSDDKIRAKAQELTTIVADETSVRISQINSLTTSVNDINNAGYVTQAEVNSSVNSASASLTTLINAEIDDIAATYYSKIQTDANINSAVTTYDSLLDARFDQNTGIYGIQIKTAADAATAAASAATTLAANIYDGSGNLSQAFIDEVSLVAVEADGTTIAASIAAYTVSAGGSTHTIEDIATASISSDGSNFNAQWGVKTTLNNLTHGVGFYVSGGVTSFVMTADNVIMRNAGTSTTASLPFVFRNNVLYLEEAAIEELSVTKLTGQIESAQIKELTVDKLSGDVTDVGVGTYTTANFDTIQASTWLEILSFSVASSTFDKTAIFQGMFVEWNVQVYGPVQNTNNVDYCYIRLKVDGTTKSSTYLLNGSSLSALVATLNKDSAHTISVDLYISNQGLGAFEGTPILSVTKQADNISYQSSYSNNGPVILPN